MKKNILVRNNVKVFGKAKQPIMFAHGFGCNQSIWRKVTPAFENDYQVIVFDYVGSGKSDILAYKPDRYKNLNGYVQDIIEICHELNLNEIIFVGHSVSAVVGILVSLKQKGLFSKMILLGPNACYFNYPPDYKGGYEQSDINGLLDLMSKNYASWASYVAPAAMKNPDRPELATELENSFHLTDREILHQFAKATFFADLRADLPKVEVPSLILQTADDTFVPIEAANYLNQHLPASKMKLMEATGHFPHLSSPEETTRLIKEYLNAPGQAEQAQ